MNVANLLDTLNEAEPLPLPPTIRALLRRSIAWALRHAPEVPGRRRLGAIANRLLWPSAADAIVTAPMRLGYKMILDLRSYTEYRSYYTGDYGDMTAIRTCLRILQPDSVALDVGANVGFLAVPMAQAVYTRGALVAFEPLAANFHRLRENLRINGVLNDDAIYQLGLSDRRAVAMLSLRGDFRNGAATGNAAIVEGEGHGFDVERIELETLDDVFPRLKLDRLHFIKLDIEGHEIAFLAGAAATIKQFRPVIYTEINDFYFAERGERAAELFSRWADEHSYDFATIRRGRIERIVLHHMPNVLMDVFLVPQERFDWFLKAAGSR